MSILRIFQIKITLTTNRDNLLFPFQSGCDLYLNVASLLILNRSDMSGYYCLISDSRGKSVSLLLLSMIVVRFSQLLRIRLRSESESHLAMSDSLRPHGLQPATLFSPWNSPGKNAGVYSQPLLQGISPTQGSNPGLLHCRQIPYHLSHQGSFLNVYFMKGYWYFSNAFRHLQK